MPIPDEPCTQYYTKSKLGFVCHTLFKNKPCFTKPLVSVYVFASVLADSQVFCRRKVVRGKKGKEKSALMSIPDLQTCAQVFELKHDPFIRLVTVEVSPRKGHISYVSCILQQAGLGILQT